MKASKAIYTRVGSDEVVHEWDFPSAMIHIVRAALQEKGCTAVLSDVNATSNLCFIYLAAAKGEPVCDLEITKKLTPLDVNRVRLEWDFDIQQPEEEDGEEEDVVENPTDTQAVSS